MERIGELGSDVAVILLCVGIFAAAAAAGLLISNKAKSDAAGWATGVASFVLMSIVFGPAIEALRQV